LGDDFELKICDFDASYKHGDVLVCSRGTKHYRAPEIAQGKAKNPFQGDIYAAGVLLFCFLFGNLPYFEGEHQAGLENLHKDLYNDTNQFWASHSLMNADISFSGDFKRLFEGMVKENPAERMTISEIKKSKWYNGAVLTTNQLKASLRAVAMRK